MQIKEEAMLNVVGSHGGVMMAYGTASKDGVYIIVQEQSGKVVDLEIDNYSKMLTWEDLAQFSDLSQAANQVLRDSGVKLEGWV